jgi:hypothetical protein
MCQMPVYKVNRYLKQLTVTVRVGLGSLAWAGHQIHIALPINTLLDAGVDPKEIPLPHD